MRERGHNNTWTYTTFDLTTFSISSKEMVVTVISSHLAWKVKFFEFLDDDVATAETSSSWVEFKCSNLGAGRYHERLQINLSVFV